MDIDEMEQLKTSFSDEWPCQVFTDMDSLDARLLLKRLLRAKKDPRFLRLEGKYSIFSQGHTPAVSNADPGILRAFLDRGEPEAISQAEQGVYYSCLFSRFSNS